MLTSLLIFLMLVLQIHSAPCVCHSIGNVTYQNSNSPTNATGEALVSQLALANGTNFMWSNDPVDRNLTSTLYARPVHGTFVCSCEDVERAPTIRYIVSGVQTDILQTSARTCLGTTIMTEICATLSRLGLMTCANTWSSGISGFAHTAAVETGVLVDAVRRISRRMAGACSATIAFEGALDAVTDVVL